MGGPTVAKGENHDHVPCTEIAVLRAQHDDCHKTTTESLNAVHAKVNEMRERMNEIASDVRMQRIALESKTKLLIVLCGTAGPIIAIVVAHFLK